MFLVQTILGTFAQLAFGSLPHSAITDLLPPLGNMDMVKEGEGSSQH